MSANSPYCESDIRCFQRSMSSSIRLAPTTTHVEHRRHWSWGLELNARAQQFVQAVSGDCDERADIIRSIIYNDRLLHLWNVLHVIMLRSRYARRWAYVGVGLLLNISPGFRGKNNALSHPAKLNHVWFHQRFRECSRAKANQKSSHLRKGWPSEPASYCRSIAKSVLLIFIACTWYLPANVIIVCGEWLAFAQKYERPEAAKTCLYTTDCFYCAELLESVRPVSLLCFS